MLDLKRIRDEPDVVREGLERRDATDALEAVDRVLGLDERRRALIREVDELRAERNEVSPQVGRLKAEGREEDASRLIERMRGVSDRIGELESELGGVEEEVEALLLGLPNPPAEEVPVGGEDANRVLRDWGEARTFDFEPRPHWEIGEALGILDLARGAKIAGSGFPLYVGAGARLERALIDFMVDLQVREHGYTELWSPLMVNHESARGSGHLPKFREDMYEVPDDELFLVPTAEVPISNLHRDEILGPDEMPRRYVAYTPCFRREAGAHGRETRGLIRVHQFDKVELFRFERPEAGDEALEEMLGHAEEVLRRLGLRYRVVLLATGDLGFASAKTYDLEVWAPGVGRWLEVSSCSTDRDFQARRAGVRFRPAPNARPRYAHTLNGSALALARTVVALLETYQEADGRVRLPDALASCFGAEHLG
ncbi:MAG: serine--tRNA ligase, partial [Gemmatimonadota bacterium]